MAGMRLRNYALLLTLAVVWVTLLAGCKDIYEEGNRSPYKLTLSNVEWELIGSDGGVYAPAGASERLRFDSHGNARIFGKHYYYAIKDGWIGIQGVDAHKGSADSPITEEDVEGFCLFRFFIYGIEGDTLILIEDGETRRRGRLNMLGWLSREDSYEYIVERYYSEIRWTKRSMAELHAQLKTAPLSLEAKRYKYRAVKR